MEMVRHRQRIKGALAKKKKKERRKNSSSSIRSSIADDFFDKYIGHNILQ